MIYFETRFIIVLEANWFFQEEAREDGCCVYSYKFPIYEIEYNHYIFKSSDYQDDII